MGAGPTGPRDRKHGDSDAPLEAEHGPPQSTEVESGLPERYAIEADRVIVVGYDAWTPAVVEELLAQDCRPTVVLTDGTVAESLRDRGLDVVETDDVDEASFRDAGIADADAVFVATLDEQLNVLAVLTVMNVDPRVEIATFAAEAGDVQKLRRAGADTVISLGAVVGELLVEVALTDRSVRDVVAELTQRY